MTAYHAPVEDTLFLLNDVFHMSRHSNLDGFCEATPDMVAAILAEGGRFCEETLHPLNRVGDVEGCKRADDGSVTTAAGFREAFQIYKKGGWLGLSVPDKFGGQNLPGTLNMVMQEYMSAANIAWGLYPGLTQGAIAAILAHGSADQKADYVPKMTAAEWTGTMNLTEPHCGTDLGLIKTKAVPQADGSYQISGQKIFISAGEHDLAENIVHLVLARIEGAPAGTKGISMFIVPKYIPDNNGHAGARNGVTCGSLEDKMGLHGNATCVMNYDAATGWLIGEENRGLNAMFVMMNEARLSVGIQGLGVSEVAYQNAVAYAKERRQGRALMGPAEADQTADPILVHPDVRRMLMEMKSFNEAARALMIWTSLKADELHRSEDAEARQMADDHLGLMTPVIKGVFTDGGFQNAVKAQQIFGGHGYIAEWGMEQFVRDARIAMIYEGANGIQALDLVGRKLPKNGGRALQAFMKDIGAFLAARAENEDMAPFTGPMKKALQDLQSATLWLMQNAMANPNHAGAASTDYMHLMGLVAMGYMWLRMAQVAQDQLQDQLAEPAKAPVQHHAAFLEAKLVTARFFMERMLPETAAHLQRISSGADSMMALTADAF